MNLKTAFVENLSKLSDENLDDMLDYFGASNIDDLAEIIIDVYASSHGLTANMDFPPEIWAKIAQNPNLSQSDRLNLALASKRMQTTVGPIIEEKVQEEIEQEARDALGLQIIEELDKSDPSLHRLNMLIRSGQANLNVKKGRKTPLSVMSEAYNPRYFNLYKLLIYRGANVKDARFALHHMLKKTPPDAELIKLLIDHGANIHSKLRSNDNTLLHTLIEHNPTSYDVMKLLIDNGADVTAKNEKGYTPLGLLFSKNPNVENLKFVLQYGGDPTDLLYNFVISRVNRPITSEDKEIFNILINNGADVNYISPSSESLLHIATKHGVSDDPNIELMKLLIDNGANVNTKNGYGNTPLIYAARKFNVTIESIKLLIDNGADISIKNNIGRTPLDEYLERSRFASRKSDIPIITELLSIGEKTPSPSPSSIDYSSSEDNGPEVEEHVLADGTSVLKDPVGGGIYDTENFELIGTWDEASNSLLPIS